MNLLDWLVLGLTLSGIVGYGVYKTRKNQSVEGFLTGDHSLKWPTIGLSIMATQASAITFLSTPGQAFQSGMGFVQFYFGLPIAMIIISAFFLPRYYKLNVFTAYEYLEQRFDGNTRIFTASLFLLSRGLAAGITIYAPAIILSTLLGWDLNLMNIAVGVLVIIYTVSGGTKAVSLTQKWQMGVIFLGMALAFYYVLQGLPDDLSFLGALEVAGWADKMEIINTDVSYSERYTLWSGLTGGLFLALSYFGTDQSQVQRYLGGKSLKESRLGLLFNGLFKVPMQFAILLVGIMVFVFYQYTRPPVFFNQTGYEAAVQLDTEGVLEDLNTQHIEVFEQKKAVLNQWDKKLNNTEEIKAQYQELNAQQVQIKNETLAQIKKLDKEIVTKDSDYVFLTFVVNHLPHGIIGILLAVIFSAAMSSTAGELNALASTTMVDFVDKYSTKKRTEKQNLQLSKIITLVWGIGAIGIALAADLFDNLIQLVNLLGSLFYGTILGIFLVAFFIKFVKARAMLYAALLGEALVLGIHALVVTEYFDIGFLWYNAIGCAAVVIFALIFQGMMHGKTEAAES
ncbi:MAG: hypothetical protein SchgKO_07300 [Schleiferiaceae bacterium]